MKQINIEKYNSHDFEGMVQEKWPFSQMPNYVLQNIDNAVAQGVWTHVQSLPPDWSLNKTYIINKFSLSEKLYKKTMSYLKRCNLIDYEKYRSSTGTFIKTRIVVKNGSKFIHPKDHKNEAMQLNPSINDNIFNDKSTGVENDLVDECSISTGAENDPGGYRPESDKVPLTNITNIKNINITTTTPDSSSSIDIQELEEFGFQEFHAQQLSEICESVDNINYSIINYKEALKNKLFNSKIKNKVGYFMGIMRTAGVFEPVGKRVLTPIEQKTRYHIENNLDNRYGI
jgi:hypothetical protein